jgi:hypothetical protein
MRTTQCAPPSADAHQPALTWPRGLVLVAVGAQVLMVRALVRTLVRALVLVLRAPLVRALVAGALLVR